jgi:serine/threonine protein kinase/tetratricopeptide (TPR) repeat protein
MVGRTLGRYEIVEQLGAGGMGEVYRARDARLNRDVAVKVLGSTAFASEDARSRFRQEAQALSRLNHPNIASIYDFQTQDGIDFLVMELVPGSTLSEKLRGGPLAEKEVLHLGRQLMDGLAASHEAGIIHRDLKPGNIRITPDGRLKILDFGLAKQIHPRTFAKETTVAATAPGSVVGTVPYMAPEQLRAEGVDGRTDIYGAGTVLYEMATGRRPFAEESGPLLTDEILNRAPVSPRSLNPRLSPGLEQVILKALEKDPDYRYQSAHEAAVDLDRLALGRLQTTASEPFPGVRRAGRPWRARRGLFLSLSAGSVLAVVVLVLLVATNRPALSFAARDWILLADVENTTGDTVFDNSLDMAFRVSLEQSMYANVFSQSRVSATLARMGKKRIEKIEIPVGREICQREGIRALVAPAVAQVGQQYSVTARLIDPATGDTVRSYAELASDRNQVLTAVDRVAGRLRRDLGESLQGMRRASTPLPQATTASLEALKAFAEAGLRERTGDYDLAVRLFTRALQLDPEFALAHAGLGGLYMSHIYNDSVRGRQHLEQAMELRQRATERERLIVELDSASALGHIDEAVRIYKLYLASWPDDVVQRYNLGNVLRDSGQVADAIDQYKRVIETDPDNAAAHVNLATCYEDEGRFREAVGSWERAFALEPGWIVGGNLNQEYGFALVGNGEPARAREVFERAINDKGLHAAGLRSAGLLDLYEGKYKSAQARFQDAVVATRAARAPLSEARNHLFLAITRAARGRRAGALDELGASFELRDPKNPQAWLWARVAAMYAVLGTLPEAERLLAVVRVETALDAVDQRATLHWLEGELELAKGRPGNALEKFRVADDEHHSAVTQEALARAYRADGDRASAIAAYEKLVAGTVQDCTGWEVQVACVAAKYELASLYQADKQPEKARRHLDALLAQWQAGDADMPLLVMARRLRAQIDKE